MQGQEDLSGREPVSQKVRGMYRERRFSDPRHAADRVDAHHPARTSGGVHQLLKLPLPPGERGDVVRQGPGRRRTVGHGAAPCDCLDLARAGPIRCRASASSRTVSFCGMVTLPRSRSLTDRRLTPDASASSSCVSPASVRSFRRDAGEGNRRLSHRLSSPCLPANRSILPGPLQPESRARRDRPPSYQAARRGKPARPPAQRTP